MVRGLANMLYEGKEEKKEIKAQVMNSEAF